ncbi:5970_t:CDS:2 [Entrophospora sp. SA101]|nr:5970_t:CDS:2 [Entrophospora sp. SA101]
MKISKTDLLKHYQTTTSRAKSTNTTTTKLCEFEAMDDEHKWKLLLCSETKNIFSNSLLHSFVINIDDPKIKEIFNEIKNISLKSDPEPSEMFKVELNNLCKTTTIEIQDALNKLHTKISTSNEADKFPLDTFHYAVHTL